MIISMHPAGDPAMAALASALQRLEDAVDGETVDLEAHRPLDLDEINRRKSRILLELTRVLRVATPGSDATMRERIARLRGKLAKNQAVLSAHLAAAQEIAAVLAGVVRDAESDGTYSTPMSGAGRFR